MALENIFISIFFKFHLRFARFLLLNLALLRERRRIVRDDLDLRPPKCMFRLNCSCNVLYEFCAVSPAAPLYLGRGFKDMFSNWVQTSDIFVLYHSMTFFFIVRVVYQY